MNKEKVKQLHRNKTKAKVRAKKRQIKRLKSIKKLISKIRLSNPVSNLVSQLKEQKAPSFDKNAYQQNNANQPKKKALTDGQFKINKWQPPLDE